MKDSNRYFGQGRWRLESILLIHTSLGATPHFMYRNSGQGSGLSSRLNTSGVETDLEITDIVHMNSFLQYFRKLFRSLRSGSEVSVYGSTFPVRYTSCYTLSSIDYLIFATLA